MPGWKAGASHAHYSFTIRQRELGPDESRFLHLALPGKAYHSTSVNHRAGDVRRHKCVPS